jgi:hypothetical protein
VWWTHSWVARFFTGEWNDETDIPAAMKKSSVTAFILAIAGALQWICAAGMIGIGEHNNVRLFWGLFIGIMGTGSLLMSCVIERIELLIFALLWDRRRRENDELRRVAAADL